MVSYHIMEERGPYSGSLVHISFEIIIPSLHTMNPLKMLPEIVCPRPFLFLLAATLNDAPVVFAISTLLGMAASLVTIDIVRGAEAFGTGAAGDVAVVWLLMLLLVLPSGLLSMRNSGKCSKCDLREDILQFRLRSDLLVTRRANQTTAFCTQRQRGRL